MQEDFSPPEKSGSLSLGIWRSSKYVSISEKIILVLFPAYVQHCIRVCKELLIFGNVTLTLQLQATILSMLACLMAITLGWMGKGQMPFEHAMVLCSAGVSTAFLASLTQGKTEHLLLNLNSTDIFGVSVSPFPSYL